MATTPPPGSTKKPRVAKSRIILLDAGQSRPTRGAYRTMLPTGVSTADSSTSTQEVFRSHFDEIRQFVEGCEIGVAVIAVERSSNKLAGRLWVAGKVDDLGSAVIGRHGSVDLFLDDDFALSNRHVAVLVEPLTESARADQVRFRLLDLRTGMAMRTERGTVETIIAEGPLFVTVGRYQLLVFQTGSVRWPDDPSDAWTQLPKHTVVDNRLAKPEPSRWTRSEGRQRQITLLPGVHHVGEHTAGPPLGKLTIRSLWGESSRTLGEADLARGILLGREPRCDFAGLLAIAEVSRVHVMIVSIADRIFAIDVGSMAGLWNREGHRRLRSIELDRPRKLMLGNGFVDLSWTPTMLH